MDTSCFKGFVTSYKKKHDFRGDLRRFQVSIREICFNKSPSNVKTRLKSGKTYGVDYSGTYDELAYYARTHYLRLMDG